MEHIVNLDSVSEYSKLRGADALHPQVNILDYKDLKPLEPATYKFGFYAVYIKETLCGDLYYGKQKYDYQEESLVCVAPNQILTIKKGNNYPGKGKVLLFHPDFIHGTALGKIMTDYSFFSYSSNEALHLSTVERNMLVNMYDIIANELKQNVDKHTKKLIVSHIQLLLDYANRYYDRQFITREHVNRGILERFENLLNDYFLSDKLQLDGLPTVGYCADELHLSANYFGDLIKKETGNSAQEYILTKVIDVAKERVFNFDKTINEISYELGFKYPQHFNRLFKNKVGVTPNEYRSLN